MAGVTDNGAVVLAPLNASHLEAPDPSVVKETTCTGFGTVRGSVQRWKNRSDPSD